MFHILILIAWTKTIKNYEKRFLIKIVIFIIGIIFEC